MKKTVMRPAMLLAGLWATVATAHAMSSFPLPQFYEGNLQGLAYRETDGHFFVTQDTNTYVGQNWRSMVYELDGAGTVLRSVDLQDLDPAYVGATTISALKDGGDLIVLRYKDLAVGGPYAPVYFGLSSDFSKISRDALPDALKNQDYEPGNWEAQVTETHALSVHNGSNAIRTKSLLDGTVRSVDLSAYVDTAIGCYDQYLERQTMCMTSVAPSWNGGYFLINEGGLEPDSTVPTARLMEFSADGTLVHAMTLDYETFDYHPTAIDIDEAGKRIFISFNSHKVVTLDDADFRAGQLTVPEPSTWALLGLGALLMPLAVRRARRQA